MKAVAQYQANQLIMHKEATMTLAQALINTELASNETRAMKFRRNACEILEDKATIVTCPDCEGLRYHEKQCDCYPNPNGCSECGGKGWYGIRCNTCGGEGQVLMYKDGHTEVLI